MQILYTLTGKSGVCSSFTTCTAFVRERSAAGEVNNRVSFFPPGQCERIYEETYPRLRRGLKEKRDVGAEG